MPVNPRKKHGKLSKPLRRKVNPMVRPTPSASTTTTAGTPTATKAPTINTNTNTTTTTSTVTTTPTKAKKKKSRSEAIEAVKRRQAMIKAAALERGGDEEWAQLILEYQSACLRMDRYEQYVRAALEAERNCEALLRSERQLSGQAPIEPARRRLESARADAISPLATADVQPCFACPRLQASDSLVLVDRRVMENLLEELGKRRFNGARVATKMRAMEEKHQTFITEMVVSTDAFEKTYTMLMQEIYTLRRAMARHVQRRPAVLIPRTPIENGWTLPREQAVVEDPAMRTPFTGRIVEETRYNPSVEKPATKPRKRRKTQEAATTPRV